MNTCHIVQLEKGVGQGHALSFANLTGLKKDMLLVM